jgi:Na+-translocating ferredoxin:NAD+ oxidoreductase subunit B
MELQTSSWRRRPGGVGLTFGVLIAVANRKFRVGRTRGSTRSSGMLPGSNCGACGRPAAAPSPRRRWRGGGAGHLHGDGRRDREEVAAFLGVDAGEAVKRVARLLCAGGSTWRRARRSTAASRAARRRWRWAAAARGAPGGAWGYADCAVACDLRRDRMNAGPPGRGRGQVHRLQRLRGGVPARPLHADAARPQADRAVQEPAEGEAATAVCSVACNACGRCVADAAPGLIEMQNGLADRLRLRPDRARRTRAAAPLPHRGDRLAGGRQFAADPAPAQKPAIAALSDRRTLEKGANDDLRQEEPRPRAGAPLPGHPRGDGRQHGGGGDGDRRQRGRRRLPDHPLHADGRGVGGGGRRRQDQRERPPAPLLRAGGRARRRRGHRRHEHGGAARDQLLQRPGHRLHARVALRGRRASG